MKFNNKGFSLIEGLIGLTVFSLIMFLYLPSFYLELARISDLAKTTEQWHIFYQLTTIALDTSLSEDIKENFLASVIENNLSIYTHPIQFFACDSLTCQIIFEDGSEFYVEVQEVSE